MRRILIVCLAVTFSAGCARLDPQLIQAGGSDYNMAMQRTQNEQMLLNLVRLKYRDTPYFMEAGSVSSQFSLSTGASASADLGTRPIIDSLGLGGNVSYAEEPTVTYLPLSGNDFVQRLLVPVTTDTLLLLANSGWNLERVLRLCVERINGIPNAPRASGPTPATAPEFEGFMEVVAIMESLRRQDRIRIAYRQQGEQRDTVMRLIGSGNDAEVMKLKHLLGLSTEQNEFRLIAGKSEQQPGDTIIMATRSLQGILYYLSHAVDAPSADREGGLVTTTRNADGSDFDWTSLTRNLFHVHSSANSSEQSGHGLSTRYRGHTFYIDDSDLDSKSTFTLLTQLFSLQAGKAEGIAPVLTIPIGR